MPFAVTNDAARKCNTVVDPIRLDNMSVHAMLSLRRGVATGLILLVITLLARGTAAAATVRGAPKDSLLQAAVATTTTSSRNMLLRNPVDPTRAAVAVAIAACCRCGEATQTDGGGS